MEGKLYADQVNLKTLKVRRQPKIVTLVAVQNSKGQWLLYKRKHQPLINQIGFPYGKLHLGETVQEAAERELMEKTGMTCKLTHKGDGYIIIHEENEPVSQICFHLFYGRNPKGKMKTETQYGWIRWSEEADDFTKPPFMASMNDLMKLIKTKKDRFFIELVYK
jgi:ADP-ribose pyrophosphatase YjhB (NUDIX family)